MIMAFDQIDAQISAIQWRYAGNDPQALTEIRKRIITTGQNRGLITYSDLVQGIIFRLANIRHGAPYEIDVTNWTGLDRNLVGDFLGYISGESYRVGEFFATALVVGKVENKPSDHFFAWMKHLRILPDLKESTVLAFWGDQVTKAHAYYQRHNHH